MARKKKNPAEREAALIREAAKITGKPETELTVQDAETVLFGEIGVTTPKTPRQQARRILQNKVVKQMAENPLDQQQEKQEAQEAAPERFDPETAGEIIGQTAATLIEAGDYGTAAGLVAEAAKEMTPQEALEILERGSDNPEMQAELEAIAERAARVHLFGLTPEEWEPYRKRLQEAQDAGGEPARLEESERIGEELSAQLHAAAQQSATAPEAPAEPEQEDSSTYSVVIPLAAKDIAEAAASAQAALYEILASVSKLVKSDTFRAIQREVAEITNYIAAHREEIAAIAETSKEIAELAPFVQIEMEALKESSDWADIVQNLEGKPLEALIEDGIDADGNPIPGPLATVIERAKQRKADYEAAAETVEAVEKAQEEIPRIKYKKTTEIKTVTDKLANVFFSLMAPAASETNGQRQMNALRYEGKKSKKEITLFYDYVYNEEVLEKYGLSKKFDDFDFFVMSILDTLYAAGNDTVSFSKIFSEMGGEDSPTGKQLEPIYYSLLKGLTTIITIDDAEAQKAWNTKSGTYREIVSPVMPVQLGNERFVANGKIAKGYVKINGFSPFMQVAKPLGHITAWDKGILRLYKGRKTKRYYSVMRFLMLQIGWMRNGPRSRKITYSSLYDYTGDKTTREKQLARDMMYRLLEEVFKPAAYITAYKEEANPTPGVVLTLNKDRLKITGK